MLGSSKIISLLRTRWAGRNTVYKDITGSTNDDAKELAAAGADHGTLVVADRQDTGRGSRGRSWETPPGANIAMSLIVRPNIPIDRVPMLTLVMGLSVAEGADEAIRETIQQGAETAGQQGGEAPSCGATSAPAGAAANSGSMTMAHEDASNDDVVPACGIKWPNDVVLAGRKICGILTELHMNPDGSVGDVVIGVGINVNMKHEDFAESIRDVAGSLLTGTGLKVDRSLVVARVMERFEEN
ncbi:MAG: biotin--[acetyl-CoA-carboxylase] ligase family protein, partial [Butyrivibrio sp.]|nr:biotin--[acetyl-CoA-carboxylase] ligase family protein [Butyrivibrio sp.]